MITAISKSTINLQFIGNQQSDKKKTTNRQKANRTTNKF